MTHDQKSLRPWGLLKQMCIRARNLDQEQGMLVWQHVLRWSSLSLAIYLAASQQVLRLLAA